MNDATITTCKQCGGLTSWEMKIDQRLVGETTSIVPPSSLALCLGHPAPQHDGRLDTRFDETHARVSLEDNFETWDDSIPKLVYISGGYGDCENYNLYLDPAQALSLLAWLKQEEETLKKLVGGDEA